MLVASRYGRGPSVLASALSVAAFDFFFVPPQFTFAVSDLRYMGTFAVMFLVGLVISNLTASLRTQARVAGYREKRAGSLYELSRQLARCHNVDDAVRTAVKQIGIEFDSQSVILFPTVLDASPIRAAKGASVRCRPISRWRSGYDNGRIAGRGTEYPARSHLCPSSAQRNHGRAGVPVNCRVYCLNSGVCCLPQPDRARDRRVRLGDRPAPRRSSRNRARELPALRHFHDLRTPLSSIVRPPEQPGGGRGTSMPRRSAS
jgi:two-component system sensor histidine kinase KdpD